MTKTGIVETSIDGNGHWRKQALTETGFGKKLRPLYGVTE